MSTPKFIAQKQSDFAAVLRRRVRSYFTDNNLSQKDDGTVAFKGVTLLALYILPFVAILAWQPANALVWLGLAALQGIGMAGVGMCLMHDSLHGAISSSRKVNERWGASMYLLGGSVFSWNLQHNRAHHTYTNVLGHDEDIRERQYLRFCPNAPWKPIHRFQHLYALLLYPMMTFSLLLKDFTILADYDRSGLLASEKTTYGTEMRKLIFGKGLFMLLFIGLPVLLGALSILQSILYFTVVLMVAGLIMSIIFQLAHVVEETTHPIVSSANVVENDWMIHQLETTVNFCPRSRLLNWYTGGLNYQVEHHLFPNICHIHYPALSAIVRKTAEEFGIVYNQVDSFGEIFASHLRFLKTLGQRPEVAVAVA